MLKRIGERLLTFYCHPDFQEDIKGDLDEHYAHNFEKKGAKYANLLYLLDAILLFRIALLKRNWISRKSNSIDMVRNIIKTALRIFWKEKGYSLLNVMGLTVGITASALLMFYVDGEKSVNKFHRDMDRIFQVMENQDHGTSIFTTSNNPGPLKDALKSEMPEIEYIAQYSPGQERLFKVGNESFKEKGIVASEDFFQVFTVEFNEGNLESSLTEPSVVYISQSLENRLFGDGKALNKTLSINEWGEHKIGGIFKDISSNSTVSFDFVMPSEPWSKRNQWVQEWGNNVVKNIIKLKSGVDLNRFNAKIKNYLEIKNDDSSITLFLQPFGDTYLFANFENGVQAGGRISYVKLFMAVSGFILFIACINFMNLSTARSTKRAKEVGVKKVVGSSRSQLVFQFIGESIIMALASALLAGLLIMLILPMINGLIGRELQFSILNANNALSLAALGLSVGILAGVYPAFILSAFTPIKVLKGGFRTSGWSNGIRKGLVVFQFLVSTVLIISTLVIHRQMNFIKNKNLGYEKENVVYIPLEGELEKKERQEILISQILANPNFSNASIGSDAPISINASTGGGFRWEGKSSELASLFYILQVGYDYVETLNMEIIEGRSFDPNLKSDSLHVIINEQTAREMNVEDPLNHPITFWGRTGKVIGVVKDFHFRSLHEGIEPMVISLRSELSAYVFAKMSTGSTAENLAYLESKVKEINPDYPFTYSFLNESYDDLYKSENTIGKLADYFSVVAVFISLLGLFGLASFAAEQRIKEIGIRKVLGANLFNLLILMSKGFLVLVGIGFVLAAPIGYFFMDDWLNAFEYRVEIGVSVFAVAAMASLGITILTVSYHSVKAVYTNPVKSLRYE